MALDKIFIPENHLIDGGIEDFWVDHKTFDTDIEYIRKDVLLEWAKETYLNENASAIRKVCYKQLIEKIESL